MIASQLPLRLHDSQGARKSAHNYVSVYENRFHDQEICKLEPAKFFRDAVFSLLQTCKVLGKPLVVENNHDRLCGATATECKERELVCISCFDCRES